jgi:hypothetical protein
MKAIDCWAKLLMTTAPKNIGQGRKQERNSVSAVLMFHVFKDKVVVACVYLGKRVAEVCHTRKTRPVCNLLAVTFPFWALFIARWLWLHVHFIRKNLFVVVCHNAVSLRCSSEQFLHATFVKLCFLTYYIPGCINQVADACACVGLCLVAQHVFVISCVLVLCQYDTSMVRIKLESWVILYFQFLLNFVVIMWFLWRASLIEVPVNMSH